MQLERRNLGMRVLAFLIVFFLFAYFLKKEFWKDVRQRLVRATPRSFRSVWSVLP